MGRIYYINFYDKRFSKVKRKTVKMAKFLLLTLLLFNFSAHYSSGIAYAEQSKVVRLEKDIPPMFIGKAMLSLRVRLETSEILLSGASYDLNAKISSIYSTYIGNIAVYLQLKIGKLDSGIWYVGILNNNSTEVFLKTKFTVPLSIKTGDAFNITLSLIPVEKGDVLKTSFCVEQVKTFGYDTLYNKELIRIEVGHPEGVSNKVILQGSEAKLYVRIENLFQLQLENVKLFLYFNRTLVYTQSIGNVDAQQYYSTEVRVSTFMLKEGSYYITANISYMMENLYFSYGVLSSVTLDIVKPEVFLEVDKTTIVNGDQVIAKLKISPAKAISTIGFLSIEIVKEGTVVGKETVYVIEPALEIPLRVFILTEKPTEVVTLRAYAIADEKPFYSNEIRVRIISASAILNNLIVNLKVDKNTVFDGEDVRVQVNTIPKFNISLPVSVERYLDGIWVTVKNLDVYEGEAFCTIQLPVGTNVIRAIIRVGVNEVESQRVQVKVLQKPILQLEGPKTVLANTTATFYIRLAGERIESLTFNGMALLYNNENKLVLNRSLNINFGENILNIEFRKDLGKYRLEFMVPTLKLSSTFDFEVISPNFSIILPKTIEENSEFQVKVISEQKINMNATLTITNQESGKNVLSKKITVYNGEALDIIKGVPMGKYTLTLSYQNYSLATTTFTVIRISRNINIILSTTRVEAGGEITVEVRLAPPPSTTTIALIEIYSEGTWIPLKSIPIGSSGIAKEQIQAPKDVGTYKLRAKVGEAVDEKEFEVIGQAMLAGIQPIAVIGAVVGISAVLYLVGRRK